MSEERLCSVCLEPLHEEEEGSKCAVCSSSDVLYEELLDDSMYVKPGSSNWKWKPSELLIPVRHITQVEWEAMGNKWFISWEDEYERVLKMHHRKPPKTWFDFHLLIGDICGRWGVLIPMHALTIVTMVYASTPELGPSRNGAFNPFKRLLQIHPTLKAWLLKKKAKLSDYRLVKNDAGKWVPVPDVNRLMERVVGEILEHK